MRHLKNSLLITINNLNIPPLHHFTRTIEKFLLQQPSQQQSIIAGIVEWLESRCRSRSNRIVNPWYLLQFDPETDTTVKRTYGPYGSPEFHETLCL